MPYRLLLPDKSEGNTNIGTSAADSSTATVTKTTGEETKDAEVRYQRSWEDGASAFLIGWILTQVDVKYASTSIDILKKKKATSTIEDII